MKKIVLTLAVLSTAIGIYSVITISEVIPLSETPQPKEKEAVKKLEPHDQWLTIRSYPEGFDQAMFLERMEEIKLHAIAVADNRDVELSLDWKEEGPGNIGGHFDVLTVSPDDHNVIYAGANNGGVFKTINGGEDWVPIFDDQPYLAIGAITLDPDNNNIVYVGTGDRNFSGMSFIGNGVYKSLDAGSTWEPIGLETTGAITEIIIDPTDTDRIFASTLGNPFVKNLNRGVYRSDDGGTTWTNKLFVADSAGIPDLIMDPSNPNILYATGFNRMRNYYGSTTSGPNSRIFKTIDAGETWTELSGGLPVGNEGRIGLAISNDDPSIIYALYVNGYTQNLKNIYKSTDSGTSWNSLDVYSGPEPLSGGLLGGFGWYFGELYLNPFNNDQLIVPGVGMYQSLNAGATWQSNVPYWVHADKHAIAFLDETSYIIATDGGLYKTTNNGVTWTDIENIPVTQLYHIDVHPHEDGLYGGGAQDNGTISGNADNFNSYTRLAGADGFRVTFLNLDAGGWYFESQNGYIKYVPPSGPSIDVSPPISGGDRTNWDTPYLINEEIAELYAGTARVHLMTGAPTGTYEYISGDLTRVGLGGSYEGSASFHTITEIEQPKDDNDILYAGTTDGLVWRGERVGGTWEWINITGPLPNRYVTGIRCSPNNPGTVYVCFSGYKVDDDVSYLFKSDDYGSTWESIASDLPTITVNDVLIVPEYENDEYLFAALDGGVYFSGNNGDNWEYMGLGMPSVTINELHMDEGNEKLIAGTFSRSIWSYDVSWMEPIVIDDTGMEKMNKDKSLSIYPNPVVDYAYFENVEEAYFDVYAVDGKTHLRIPITKLNEQSKIDLSALNTGLYLYRVGSKSGKFMKK